MVTVQSNVQSAAGSPHISLDSSSVKPILKTWRSQEDTRWWLMIYGDLWWLMVINDDLPAGKHTKSYWKWPFSSLIYPLTLVIFHSKLLVYQRVSQVSGCCEKGGRCFSWGRNLLCFEDLPQIAVRDFLSKHDNLMNRSETADLGSYHFFEQRLHSDAQPHCIPHHVDSLVGYGGTPPITLQSLLVMFELPWVIFPSSPKRMFSWMDRDTYPSVI